eukprot:5144623-Prymnesium_polylepis.1
MVPDRPKSAPIAARSTLRTVITKQLQPDTFACPCAANGLQPSSIMLGAPGAAMELHQPPLVAQAAQADGHSLAAQPRPHRSTASSQQSQLLNLPPQAS